MRIPTELADHARKRTNRTHNKPINSYDYKSNKTTPALREVKARAKSIKTIFSSLDEPFDDPLDDLNYLDEEW